MISTRSISGGKVLCILSTSDSHPHPIVAALAEAGADVNVVGDAYRGLARLGAKRQPPFAAVVVDVDRLDPSEMEFFDLAVRYRWAVPVLVCARSAGSPRLREALLRGARAAVDPESVVDQVSRVSEPPPVSQSAPEEADGEPVPPTHAIDHDLERRLAAAVSTPDPGAENIDVGLANEVRTTGREPEAVSEELTAPETEPEPETPRAPVPERVCPDDHVSEDRSSARVPWRRYADRPQRKPPPRNSPTPTASAPDTIDRREPPLLTSEELDALIGGHIAPAASNDVRQPDHESPEEGS